MPPVIYKITTYDEWRAACAEGVYRGSDDDLRDGFIHFSTAEQLPGTAAKHFADRPDLVVIAIAAEALGDALRWEASRGGALFPHLYGTLGTALCSAPRACPLGDDGVPILPEPLPAPPSTSDQP